MDELQIEMPSNEPVITFRRRVAAHPDLVFRLFTEAQHLRRWWGPRRLELVECEIDLYIGGGYRLVQQAPDGQRFSFHGTYLAIERPHRLVQTFVYEGRPNNEVVETFSFAPIHATLNISPLSFTPAIGSPTPNRWSSTGTAVMCTSSTTW